MLQLSAFADEISPDIDVQIRVCRENAVTHFELRSVGGKNVLDLDNAMRSDVRKKLKDAGMGVICIGSPIGKVRINEPWEKHFERFRIAVDAAEFFGAPLVRLFSYYPPEGGNILQHREEVMRRFRAKLDYLRHHAGITLVHENEKDIYGEKGNPCIDLMTSFNSPLLRSAFDFANFVQAGEEPRECWRGLKPFVTHIHIKDALAGSGKVVPAGKGDGKLGPILKDAWASGYRGFLSLEPHLAAHEQFGGFSGAELFKVAADAIKALCREIEVPLAGA